MFSTHFPMRNRSTARSEELKEAIIASFRANACHGMPSFSRFDEADWKSAMWWLDVSGMAIYFLDQARRVGVGHSVPHTVIAELERRLENNRLRMASLLEESYGLAGLLEGAGIRYALLKGFTLVPDSVPESALRCQTDLDFLVSKRDAEGAMRLIQLLGYKHFATSGDVVEFRAGAPSKPDMANMYKVLKQRSLELHLLTERSCEANLLTRRVIRSFDGFAIYTLSPADTMVQQALHLLKHLCGEHTRLSWVLEFWRHAATRRDDGNYWKEVEERAGRSVNGDLAMGIAFWVAHEFFGEASSALAEQWKSECIPVRVQLWLERYARQLLTSDLIGNKLYALLRTEIPCAPHEARRTREILLPSVLPFRVLEAQSDENILHRLDRYAIELKFFLRRLGFHIRESLRLVVESARWNRAVAKVGR